MGINQSVSPKSLKNWLESVNVEITDADHRLVEAALKLFEFANVHLLERRDQGINPVAELYSLREKMPLNRPALYSALLMIFARFGDRHSRCLLPKPWNNSFAFLPFTLGRCTEADKYLYIVTGSIEPSLSSGDRIISWNNEPIEALLDQHMAAQLGANRAARVAKAIQSLTIRPLALLPPPLADAVTLIIRDTNGAERQVKLYWQVTDGADLENQFTKCLPRYPGFETVIPGLLQRRIEINDKQVGWIKVQSLRIAPDTFLPAFSESLKQMPEDGLILDFRGCEEGFISTGEAMLRCLTDKTLTPLPFQFRSTEWTRQIVTANSALSNWHGPLEQAASTGEAYSEGLPLIKPESMQGIKKRYFGNMVILVDALTYSTAEMLAASMQDHQIATIIGTDEQTGGGGASPWHQDLIFRLSNDPLFERAAGDPGLQMAVLRCHRVGQHSGDLLEGFGVKPDIHHHLTKRDVLEDDIDLAERAVHSLTQRH